VGACNDAVRPCASKNVGLMQKINSLPSGSARESACSQYTDAMVHCMNSTTPWKVKKVSNDAIYFEKTGDTMDIIKSSGGGNAESQCLLTAGPNFQPTSNGNEETDITIYSDVNKNPPTEEDKIKIWFENNGMWLGLGGVALVAVYFIFKKMRG